MVKRLIKLFSLKNILYSVFIVIFTLVAAEIILRIHNPFYTTIKGDKLFLPVNRVINFSNGIKYSINSMGFNGEEKPSDFDKDLTIIAVGGSTTRCFVLGDGKTWPYLLGEKLKTDFTHVWLNNAGFDGHSTFAHQLLINDFISKIKPKIVLFLIGVNDVGRDDLNVWDKQSKITKPATFRLWLNEHSELKNLISNIIRSRHAQEKCLATGPIDLQKMDTLTLSDDSIQRKTERYANLILQYRKRVEGLIASCRKYNIEPIFITQPLLLGSGIDSVTHVNLDKLKMTDNFGSLPGDQLNGKIYWKILQLYNNQTTEAANAAKCLVIDLGDKLPKNSLYFYDYCHYTNVGAEKVAAIIYSKLNPYLREHYGEYVKKNNLD